MDAAKDGAYPRLHREARRAFVCAALVAFVCALAGCETAECLPGDRTGCRCHDNSYGYLTCPVNGHLDLDAACDCIRGLTPDASSE